MSIFANDCYGLPLYIGDFVVSIDGSGFSGQIKAIYEAKGYCGITIFDEISKKNIENLNSKSFTNKSVLDERI